MTREEFDQVSAALDAEAKGIQKAKRPAYTAGSADVLHNFKTVAERVGVTPGQVAAIYFLKHSDAVVSALAKPHLPQAEPVIGRFADLINYAHLGYAIVTEEQMPQAQKVIEAVDVGAAGFLVPELQRAGRKAS